MMPGHADIIHLQLTLLLVFGTAKIFSVICERLGQPGLVGEIAAGVLLGPAVLHWVRPDEVLRTLAEMGVMFLLFRVGLEVKVPELFGAGRTAILVAAGGVLLPFLAGWLLLAALGISQIEAIFVGAALVATSVGITAQVLAEKGLLAERASQVILAAAVIDDVLGLLVLAVVNSVARDRVDLLGLAITAVMACGFTFLVARFGTRAVQRVVPRVRSKVQTQEVEFSLALILLFALALLATYIGVAAIIGAFLAGLAFSETAERRVMDLAHGITELLVPFFLAGIGLELQVAELANARTLWIAIGITVVAVLAKLVGCGVPALSLGRRDALRVGVGMVPRGEVGMIVAQIGLRLGVIEQPIYAAVVFMAVATTMIAPPLLNAAFSGVRPRVAEEEFGVR